jgi:hypothetical protein
MPRYIRFSRLDGGGEDAVDLDQCNRRLLGRPILPMGVPSDTPGIFPIDESTLQVFYVTPDGRWLQGMSGLRQIRNEGTGDYLERHPVFVAHTWLLFRGKLLPELEQYRPFLHLNVHQAIAAWEASQQKPPPTAGQTRLRAVVDSKPPYIVLDGKPFPAEEIAVHYLDALIKANGGQVPFARFMKQEKNQRFEGAVSTRVLDKLPTEILHFIERSQGSPPRLKVELLLHSAQ